MASVKNTVAFTPTMVPSYDPVVSWGKFALMLFAFVIIGRIQEAIPALGPAHVGVVTGGLAGLAWLLAPGSLQDKIPMRIPQVKYVVWMFLLAVLLVPIGVWSGNSFDFITGPYWKFVLFFLMVVFTARSVADMRGLIWACCVGVSALVLSGLAFGADVERFKAGSLTYDANDLALALVIALPLLVYLFSTSKPALKLLASAMIFICFYGILLTGSRGGFLALLAVGALLLSRSNIGWAAKLGIIAVVLVVFGGLAGAQYWDRMSTIWSPVTDDTGAGRTDVWKAGLQIFVTHPWGVGIDNYGIAYGLLNEGRPGVVWYTAHNSFLQIGVELGVVGLVLFVRLLVGTIRDLRMIRRTHTRQAAESRKSTESGLPGHTLVPLAVALEISLWGFMVGGFFLSQAYSPLLYAILAFSLACHRISESEQVHSSGRQPESRAEIWSGPNLANPPQGAS